MPPIEQTWLAGEEYCGSLRWFRHNRYMIKNIAHHLQLSPITKEDVVTLILPIIIICSMSCMGMATLIVLLSQ